MFGTSLRLIPSKFRSQVKEITCRSLPADNVVLVLDGEDFGQPMRGGEGGQLKAGPSSSLAAVVVLLDPF